jgi:hypothetical protein
MLADYGFVVVVTSLRYFPGALYLSLAISIYWFDSKLLACLLLVKAGVESCVPLLPAEAGVNPNIH